MKKVMLATQMIEKRIAHADHLLAGFPGERQLAEELGLGRDTVRVAVQRLVEQGALVRQKNGRLMVPTASNGQPVRTIGFVVPSAVSGLDSWRDSINAVVEEFVAAGHAVTLRPLSYAHWADPMLQEALASFDGLFFVPPHEPIPAWLTTKMRNSSCRVAVMFQDVSAAGVPCFIAFPTRSGRKLLDHLYQLGHRSIDCLNTQEENSIIQGRIGTWRQYLQEHRLEGQLFSLAEAAPTISAYRLMHEMLENNQPLSSAIFCTTGPAAIGALRALYEKGLKVGQDISLCAINSEGLGTFLCPSLTSLEAALPNPYARRFCEWMLGGFDWHGSLLVEPDDLRLFEGESTGPPRATT